jgi:pimeloyl-ACP methyl ester carboxylesterase
MRKSDRAALVLNVCARMFAMGILLAGCMADTLLLWPPKRAASYPELREMIDNNSIETFRVSSSPGEEPDAYVLCFFGNGMLADEPVAWLADMVRPLRLELWGVNYAGYGKSKGDASLAGVARTARRAYSELAKRARGKPIIVFGTSLGTTAALHVAAHEQVSQLILHNPPPLPELILRRHGWWNLFLLALPVALDIPDALDSIENAGRATAPAVFISSEDDRVVPISYQERIMKAYRGNWELLLMRGVGHNDPIQGWVMDRVKCIVGAAISQTAPACSKQ